MCSSIRIGLVTDQPIFRTGVTEALAGSGTLSVAAHGQTAGDALAMASDPSLDILLIEIEIPGVGIGTVGAICRTSCHAKVVVLTAVDDEVAAIHTLRLGARGYILKDVTGVELIRAIEAIRRGELCITPALTLRVLPRLLMASEGLPMSRDLSDLTARERQVLDYLSRGLTNREIATTLGLSVKTVKQHVTLIFAKIGVRNRVEATAALDVAMTREASTPSQRSSGTNARVLQ
jgi:two-component system, NarL family, nitrate/nitrite response regulator NarL